MNIAECIPGDTDIPRDGLPPPRIGFVSDALPEVRKPVMAENLQTGVSTKNALPEASSTNRKSASVSHWYVLRTTYGREKKAYDYIIANGGTAYYPTVTTVKLVGGKRKAVEESLIPNIFFAYGTEEEVSSFVYDNVNLPYLRFYYRQFGTGNPHKEPLVVPDHQMESFRIICRADTEDIIISVEEISRFRTGQLVRIVNGSFKGVTGRVARYQGQQRVGVIVDGLLTAMTAYIPRAFLEIVESH